MEERAKRPVFLKVICILSFIWMGLGLFNNVFGLVRGPVPPDAMAETQAQVDAEIEKLKEIGADSWVEFSETMSRMAIESNQNYYSALVIDLSILILGIFSVLRMWQGVKMGFHLYIVYSLLCAASYYFYLSPENVPTLFIVLSFIFSGIFVFMYSRNLKWMT